MDRLKLSKKLGNRIYHSKITYMESHGIDGIEKNLAECFGEIGKYSPDDAPDLFAALALECGFQGLQSGPLKPVFYCSSLSRHIHNRETRLTTSKDCTQALSRHILPYGA